MNRRDFIAGMTATTAALLIPDRRIWALDRTMLAPTAGPTLVGIDQYDGTMPIDSTWFSVVAFGSIDNGNAVWFRYRDGRYVEYHALPGGGLARVEDSDMREVFDQIWPEIETSVKSLRNR